MPDNWEHAGQVKEESWKEIKKDKQKVRRSQELREESVSKRWCWSTQFNAKRQNILKTGGGSKTISECTVTWSRSREVLTNKENGNEMDRFSNVFFIPWLHIDWKAHLYSWTLVLWETSRILIKHLTFHLSSLVLVSSTCNGDFSLQVWPWKKGKDVAKKELGTLKENRVKDEAIGNCGGFWNGIP